MFTHQQIEKLIFIDIETVSGLAEFSALEPEMQFFWEKKARQYYKAENDPNFDVNRSYSEKAGLFSEFNRVVCVSFGYIRFQGGQAQAKIKSIYSKDEKAILSETSELLKQNKPADYRLCGHNIKEFDCPTLARRMLINGISPLPPSLNNYGKKPWEVNHIDTMALWKFGDFKSYTSLALLCHLFNIPSPKTDVDGSQVTSLYWQQNSDLKAIAEYCQKDVQATMNLVLRFANMELLREENVVMENL
ncbi:MAG: ribonuclease H-like domain-containing protein [Gloeomargarita sp. DG02_5_bins_242]